MLRKPSRKSVVGGDDDPYLPMLKKLFDAVNEQNVRVENLRILLVKKGVISQAEFDHELVETQRQWNSAFSEMVSKAFQDAMTELQKRLLDSHQGKPQ